MAVTFTDSATGAVNGVQPSKSVTIPAGTVYLLVAWATGPLFTGNAADLLVNGSSAGVASLGTVQGSTANFGSAGFYTLSSPPTGTVTIKHADTTGSDQSSWFAIGFDSFSAVSAFFSNHGTSVANGTVNQTVALSGISVGDTVVSVHSDDGGQSTLASQTGTPIANFTTGGTDGLEGGQSETAAGTGPTVGWVITDTQNGFGDWCVCAVAVTPGTASPTINTQPQSVVVDQGAPVTFSVSATTSGGALSYQWQDDSSGSFSNISGATASTLTVGPVYPPLNGRRYRVNVTDSNGTTASNAATLQILYRAPERTIAPLDHAHGTNALLDVNAWAGAQGVEKWFADELAPPGGTAPAVASATSATTLSSPAGTQTYIGSVAGATSATAGSTPAGTETSIGSVAGATSPTAASAPAGTQTYAGVVSSGSSVTLLSDVTAGASAIDGAVAPAVSATVMSTVRGGGGTPETIGGGGRKIGFGDLADTDQQEEVRTMALNLVIALITSGVLDG